MPDVRGHAWVQRGLLRALLVVAVAVGLCGMHVFAATVGQHHAVARETAPVVSPVGHGSAPWPHGAAAPTTMTTMTTMTTPAAPDHDRHGAMGGCVLFLGASIALLVVLVACAAARALRPSYGVAPCWPRTSMLITPWRGPPAWRWPRFSLCVMRV